MIAKDIVRQVIDENKRWSQNKVAMALGMSPQKFSSQMNSKNGLRADVLASALELMGWKLVAVPPMTKIPRGAEVVDGMVNEKDEEA